MAVISGDAGGLSVADSPRGSTSPAPKVRSTSWYVIAGTGDDVIDASGVAPAPSSWCSTAAKACNDVIIGSAGDDSRTSAVPATTS